MAALRSAAASRPAAASATSAGSSAQENLFWQSIMNSTNPAEFEAYLRRFPNGVFSELAEARLEALRGSRVAGAPAATGTIAGGDTRARPGAGFRSDQTCAGSRAEGACWMEIARKSGCYVWNPNPQPAESVTWTGECAAGLAHGAGTLAWTSDGNQQTATGRLQNGKHNGTWVTRFASGTVQEGPIVDGEPNGNWIIRFASGEVQEGPIVDGEQNGNWVIRFADGNTMEGPYVNGVKHGRWIWRSGDGDDVAEQLYEEGEERGFRILKLGGEDVR